MFRYSKLAPILYAAGLAAQDLPKFCDAKLVAARLGSDEGYRLRGKHCEGLYERSVSGTQSFHVVSLLAGLLQSQAAEASVAWKASGAGNANLTITVRSLRAVLNYRLDAAAAPADARFAWNSLFVKKYKLTARELGVLVFRPEQINGVPEQLLLPVTLEIPGEVGTKIEGLRLIILPDEDLQDVVWAIRPVDGAGAARPSSPPISRILRGRPYPLEIGNPGAPGRYAIGIIAKAGSAGRPVNRTAYFLWP